jgi:phosphoribosylanthranilate isomerase
MAKIKICGITSAEDVNIINSLSPDYIGFVFAKSKRQLSVAKAKSLSNMVNKDIKKVGVFVNQSIDFIKICIDECGLDVVQLHGDEIYDNFKDLDAEVWKSFRIRGIEDFLSIKSFQGEYFLTDAYVKGIYGGTGTKVDINHMGVIDNKKHILAGGLTTENVKLYLNSFNPYCVDVSSSVEVEGKKDYKKIKEFIEEVRDYE